MILETILTAIVAGIVQLAQQAGQSIQQWLNSPQGKKMQKQIIQQFGQEVLTRILRKLGVDI